jgi:predicted dehydrogenase
LRGVTKRRIALVGAGQMGANHARTIFRSDEFDLGFIMDADVSRANSLAQTFGAEPIGSLDGISGIDAVIIATSTSSHYAIAREVLSIGIPVLIEKPLTPAFESTLELVDLSKSKDVPMQCGFVERFNPAFVTAHRLIEKPIVHAQSVRHSPPATRIASGVAEDLLIHDLDLAMSLTSSPIKSMTGKVFRSNLTGHDEISDCLLQLEDSSIFSLSASRMSQRKVRDWRICTDSDMFEIDLLRQTVAIYENINQEVGSGGGASYRARTTIDYPFIERAGEPLVMQLQHFAQLLDGTVDSERERQSILSSHKALSHFLTVSGQ